MGLGFIFWYVDSSIRLMDDPESTNTSIELLLILILVVAELVLTFLNANTWKLSSSELSESDIRSGNVLSMLLIPLVKHIFVKCPVFLHLSQVAFLLRRHSWLL